MEDMSYEHFLRKMERKKTFLVRIRRSHVPFPKHIMRKKILEILVVTRYIRGKRDNETLHISWTHHEKEGIAKFDTYKTLEKRVTSHFRST